MAGLGKRYGRRAWALRDWTLDLTVLLSSHVVTELERICDHLVLLHQGRARLAGDIEDLLAGHRVLTGPRTDDTAGVDEPIAAMGATLAVYLAVRLPMEEAVRPYLLTPLVRITNPAVAADIGWRPETEWVVAEGWIDATGHRLTDREEGAIIREVYGGAEAVHGAGTPIERYLADHGLRHYTEYHPGSSFLTMQMLESAVFLGLTTALLATSVWIVRRRTA